MAHGFEMAATSEPPILNNLPRNDASRSVVAGGRIHVLFLIDELCRKGGAESALLNTVCWLPADRFRCSVITFRIDPSLSMLAEFPCPLHVLPLRRTYDWNALRMGLRLAKYIHREKVDIVHTFFSTADLWGGMIAKLSRRPVLISSRRDMGFLQSAKHRIGYRALRGMFDGVLTVSEQVRQASIDQDGLDPAKVITIYNAMDTRRLRGETITSDIRQRFGIGNASHVIVSVGNLRRIKGFDIFIRAAAHVCRKFPAAMFVVAGGPYPAEPACLSELQQLSSALGIGGNMRFLGPLEDVIPLLKASDVFCLLSHSEGFSNALLEAMACGLPCVATRVGGNGEALEDGRTGFLVEDGDHEAAADRIMCLLGSPTQAKRVAVCAQDEIARRFVPEIMMSQLVQVYDTRLGVRRE